MSRDKRFDWCQVEGCCNKAKYGIYRQLPYRTKKWLRVCGACERIIGDENMRRATLKP